MIEQTLFISDLHLGQGRPDLTRCFLRFLEQRAHGVERLYILGDLFDAWVGDDDFTPPNGKIRRALKRLTEAGTAVFLQLGNRDFLLGERFARETGVQLLDDYAVIDLYGTDTLLTHGDLLCTDDVPYQQFRAKTRAPEWRRNILSKPLLLRLALARWYRFRSHLHKRRKSEEIMDVNAGAVKDTLRRFQVQRLIHGHTHRPGLHRIELETGIAERFVLAQWDRRGSVLCWSPEGHWLEAVE